ncbi:PREDICTED: serine-rich adhesin for platelets-like [Diuraphis noxia]|uniref:serine-rich adhesin for platelets-like n=1 Tax=Diuraphis noxia TaxID=143948 RepID=UPI000763A0BA|nr:PREDICTED: serine-rich adhesin for platelets-like [Diuraphis noxia]
MILLSGTLLGTISAQRRQVTDGIGGGTDEDDDNFYGEFEEKILRAWLEKYIERYNTNIQSPTSSTNIQRIAKKIRTSTSKIPMLDDEHIATLSIYPFLVNPFYQPSIYSSYIPLPFDATTHILPVGQIPYQKNEYHHRFLGPLQTQFPIGYTNVPGVMSSMLINNDPEIKKPMNVQNFISSNKQEVIQEHDKELHTSEQILNQYQDGFNHTSAVGLNLDEPKKMYQKKYDNIEQSNSKMNRKLLDHIIVDGLPNTITAVKNQTTESHEIGDLQPSTTFIDFDTSKPLDTINFPKTYLVSPLPPLSISNEPSKSEIYSNSVSQVPLSSDEFLNLAQKSSTTQESSATKQPKTTVETYSSTTTSDKNQEDSLFAEKRSQPDEPQNSHNYSNDKYTSDILRASITNIREISTEIAITTQNSEVLNESSTLPTTTTTSIFSTPLCENNDSKISISTSAVRDKTVVHSKSYKVPVQININSESNKKFIKVSNEQDNIIDLISSSTRPSVTSETSILPFTSSIMLQSLPQHSKYYSSTKLPNLKSITDENNTIQTTSSGYTSFFPTNLQPLNIKNITTSILLETKTEQTPLITLNSNEYNNNIKQNANIPRHHFESTRSFSTPTMFIPLHDIFSTLIPVNIVQNNLPSDGTTNSNNYQSRNIPTSTEKSNTYKDHNINNYTPTTTKGTKKSSLTPTVKPINQYNSVHKKINLDVVSDDSKFRKTTNNQDRYLTETSNIPQSIEDSELWYDHMYPQNELKKEANEKQIHVLLKKIIKLLKPEIEKQTLTKESVARLTPPKLGDPEKFVYIIYPWIIDEAKNIENEERTKTNANPITTSDKL